MGEKDANYAALLNEQGDYTNTIDAFSSSQNFYMTPMHVDPTMSAPSEPLYNHSPPQPLSDPTALAQFIQSLPSEQYEAIRMRNANIPPQGTLDGFISMMGKVKNTHSEQSSVEKSSTLSSYTDADPASLLHKINALTQEQKEAMRSHILKVHTQSKSQNTTHSHDHHTGASQPFISLPTRQTDLSQFVYVSPPRSKLHSPEKIEATENVSADSTGVRPEKKLQSQPNRPLSEWLGDFLKPRSKSDAMSNMREIVKDLGEDKIISQQEADRIFFVDAVTSGANAEFHRSILSSKSAMRLLKTWLLNSLKAKDPFASKVMQLLDTLPWQVDDIKTVKELDLGKLIRIAGKEPSAKEVSVRLQQKILRLLEQESKLEDKQEEGPRKKVKLENGNAANAIAPPTTSTISGNALSAPASSKPATATAIAKTAVKSKATVRTTLTALDSAKTYNSFFDQLGASKAKPPPAKKSAVPPVSQVKAAVPPPPAPPTAPSNTKPTSVIDSVIGSMASNKKEKPSEPAVPKKRKRVTFKPDEDLVQIRWIELVDRDGNPRTSHHATGEARDLDVKEGHQVRSLMGHTDAVGALIEEVEWSIPVEIELPEVVAREIIERGKESSEIATQEEREQHVVGAVYIFAAQIPDSPAEPKNFGDANPYGNEGDPKLIIFPQSQQPQHQDQAQPASNPADLGPLANSLESLLRSLQPAAQQPPPMPDLNSLLGLPQANAPAYDFNSIMNMLSNAQQPPVPASASMQLPMQMQMQMPMQVPMPMQMQHPPPELHTQTPKWNPNWAPRVPCKYWKEGKCRKGDQCTFKHTAT